MKQTVTGHDFVNAFMQSDNYKNNFTFEALNCLFEYFEEYEYSTGEQIEFDMVAICCEYSEQCVENMKIDFEHMDGIEECKTQEDLFSLLEDFTSIIPVNDTTFIIQDF